MATCTSCGGGVYDASTVAEGGGVLAVFWLIFVLMLQNQELERLQNCYKTFTIINILQTKLLRHGRSIRGPVLVGQLQPVFPRYHSGHPRTTCGGPAFLLLSRQDSGRSLGNVVAADTLCEAWVVSKNLHCFLHLRFYPRGVSSRQAEKYLLLWEAHGRGAGQARKPRSSHLDPGSQVRVVNGCGWSVVWTLVCVAGDTLEFLLLSSFLCT